MRVILIVVGAVVVLALGVYGWTRINPTEVRAEIEIDAPVAEVWDVLTDFEAYPDWNPFIVSAEGQARVDAQLTNVMRDGESTTTFTPRVLVADGHELRWIGRFGIPGIVDGEHHFILEDLGDGRTRLEQGETFTGVLVPFAGSALDVEDNFEAMNAALKDRVEDGR